MDNSSTEGFGWRLFELAMIAVAFVVLIAWLSWGPVRKVWRQLVLIAATVAVYWNSLHAGLPFDSIALVRDDSRVQAWTWQNLLLIFGQNYWGKRFQSGLYRPVVTLSYLAQHGSPAWKYHAVNLFLHLCVTLLAYALLLQISPKVAFWASLLWAVHPVNTEAVTNVAGRPDLLAAACVLGGLQLYRMASSCRRRRWCLLGLCAVTLVGCFSKETGVLILPLILLLDRTVCGWPPGTYRFGTPWDRGAFKVTCIPAGLTILVRLALSISCGMAKPFVDNPIVGMPFWIGKGAALAAQAKLLGLWFWPATLSADYSFGQLPGLTPSIAAVVLIVLAPALLLLAFVRRHRQVGFWLWFIALGLTPTSNLIFTTGSIMAERFLYLPGIGLSVLLVLSLNAAYNRVTRKTEGVPAGQPEARNSGSVESIARHHLNLLKTSFAGALLLVTCLLGFRTILRNRDYRDDLSFWRATVVASPKSFKPHTQLSIELWKRGDHSGAIEQARLAEAILGPLPASDAPYEPYVQFWGYAQAVGETEHANRLADRIAAVFNALPKCKRCPAPAE